MATISLQVLDIDKSCQKWSRWNLSLRRRDFSNVDKDVLQLLSWCISIIDSENIDKERFPLEKCQSIFIDIEKSLSLSIFLDKDRSRKSDALVTCFLSAGLIGWFLQQHLFTSVKKYLHNHTFGAVHKSFVHQIQLEILIQPLPCYY